MSQRHLDPLRENRNVGGVVFLRAAIVVAIVAVFLLRMRVAQRRESTAPPPTVVTEVVEVNPRPDQVRFENGKCHPALIKLAGKWFAYAVGGPVQYFDEEGELVLTSRPGERAESSIKDGWYRLCPGDKEARGVDILRRPW